MRKTVTITYKGIKLEVEGYYYPYRSGTMEQPPEEEVFEIETIWRNDHDVTEIYESLIDLSEIEKECLTNLLY